MLFARKSQQGTQMTMNLNIFNDLPHGKFLYFIVMESNVCFFRLWFVKPFFIIWIRVEDTLIELYLAGNNRRPSYSAEDNQDYQMLSANGISL